MNILRAAPCLVLCFVLVESAAAQQPFVFRDVGKDAGLFPRAGGIQGHGAAWGDVDGDGWADLYVGTFHTAGAKANLFFRNQRGKFTLDEQPSTKISTRATGVVFADLDNDGDLDLFVASMPAGKDTRLGQRVGHELRGCTMFKNDGKGKFTNVSQGNAACPAAFGGRSAAVLDYNGDGRLDLLVGEDPYPGYNGSKTHSSRLFKNLGGLRFEDVTQRAGIPAGIPGLGVAAGDVNGDGWPDIFLACHRNGNRMFINDGKGKFQEAADSPALFRWKGAGEEGGDNMICGACFGDVNHDGRLDLVLGQHYSRPWLEGVPNRLYLNRGNKDGQPRFEDVTESVGLVPLSMKAPHVEIQDFDNDGRFDISASQVMFAGGKPHPVIFKNLGVTDGLPRFRAAALGVNDFPTAADRAVKRSGPFFEKMIADKKVIYSAPGPVADFDRDGRLDMFLPNWWKESPSLLLRNETPGGGWLEVRVQGAGKVNRMGIGSRVNIYPAGKIGQADALLACREIAVGFGYASGQTASAHFGLGKAEKVDIEVVLPHGQGVIKRNGVAANQRIVVQTSAE